MHWAQMGLFGKLRYVFFSLLLPYTLGHVCGFLLPVLVITRVLILNAIMTLGQKLQKVSELDYNDMNCPDFKTKLC